jgi:hypothetical protein
MREINKWFINIKYNTHLLRKKEHVLTTYAPYSIKSNRADNVGAIGFQDSGLSNTLADIHACYGEQAPPRSMQLFQAIRQAGLPSYYMNLSTYIMNSLRGLSTNLNATLTLSVCSVVPSNCRENHSDFVLVSSLVYGGGLRWGFAFLSWHYFCVRAVNSGLTTKPAPI